MSQMKKIRAVWRKKPVDNGQVQPDDRNSGSESSGDGGVNKVDQLRHQFEAVDAKEVKVQDYSRFLGWAKHSVGTGAYERKMRRRTQTCDPKTEAEKPASEARAPEGATRLWRSTSTRYLVSDTKPSAQQANDCMQKLSEMRTKLRKSRENLPAAMDDGNQLDFGTSTPVPMRPKNLPGPPLYNSRRRSCLDQYLLHRSAVSTYNLERSDLSVSMMSMNGGVSEPDTETIPDTPVGSVHPEEPDPPVQTRRTRPQSWALTEGFPGNGPVSMAMKRLSMAVVPERHPDSGAGILKRLGRSSLTTMNELRVVLDEVIRNQGQNGLDVADEECDSMLRTLAQVMKENAEKIGVILKEREKDVEVSYFSTTLTISRE